MKGVISMQIHVIQSGDTIFNLSQLYGVSAQAIIDINELSTPEQLVIGQALVIPIIGQFYTVQQGDTFISIGEKFNIPYMEVARINGLSINQPLSIGLRLYIPPTPKTNISTFGYVEPLGGTVSPTLENAVRKYTRLLTFLAPFSYRVNRDGTLEPPLLNQFLEIAADNNTYPSLVVTNLEGPSFSTELMHIVLTVQAVQNTLLDEIVNTAQKEGFGDVHFDFEFVAPEDREAYNAFLRKAKDRFTQAGLLLSTALAPKTSATQPGLLYEAHDYKAHGEIADFVVLMTYEWGYSAGPAMAVSPLPEVQKVVEYAITEIPPEKIMLGQNLYGYDWTLPFVQGESFARALSPQQAIDLARENNVAIEFDERAQAPFFTYWDAGKEHEVWFEDARSIQAKFDLMKQFNLRGIAYWKLGLAFPQNWALLEGNFTIEKKTSS